MQEQQPQFDPRTARQIEAIYNYKIGQKKPFGWIIFWILLLGFLLMTFVGMLDFAEAVHSGLTHHRAIGVIL